MVWGSRMNICFQAIFSKTIFFHAVSKRLEESGQEIFWTSTSQKWTNWLITNGTPRSRILLLQRTELTRTTDLDIRETPLLNRIEKEYGLSLKKLFLMDRIISTWPWDEAYRYMAGVVRKVDDFVIANDISVMFGESTSSDEILSAAVCKLRERTFYHPGTARIPSDRFLFFKNHVQAQYETLGSDEVTDADLTGADQIRADILAGTKPNYWYWNNKVPSIGAGFLQKIIAKVHEALVEARTDATVKSLGYHLTRQRQYLKPFRYLSLRLRPLFEQPVEGEKFVVYTLHKQPEASIDVFGADHADQAHVIKQITRHLPSNTWLYVKEHSNCIGDRTRKELLGIASLPGVRLIDPYCDIHELIRRSEAVISISGTVTFEAALYGKPAGTFSKMYFSGFSSITHLKDYSEISLLLQQDESWTEEDRRRLAHIISNSIEGVIGDPMSTPVCMIDENIVRVADGINRLCTTIQAPGPKITEPKPCVTIVCDSHGAGYGTTGFAELFAKELSPDWRVVSHAFGGLSVRAIYEKLLEEEMPDSEVAVIQVGNPDVHPRMPIRPLRVLRSLGMSFCRDSLFSIPPKPSLRYCLRFPFFLVRLFVMRFHQEFLVSNKELREDFDRLIDYVRRHAKRVIVMPVFAVHPRVYTDTHQMRATSINAYLAEKYPDMFVEPRVLRPSTYMKYYNKDGFHFIRRYHEQVKSWLARNVMVSRRGKTSLVFKKALVNTAAETIPCVRERIPVA